MKKALGNSGYIGADKSLSSEGIIVPGKTYNEVISGDPNFLPHNLPPRELILIVDTTKAGATGATQFELEMNSTTAVYSVEWGDGQKDLNITNDITHTYASSGIYQVKITGNTYIYYQASNDGDKIIEIRNFGFDWQPTNLYRNFYNCSNFDIHSKVAPNLPNSTSTNEMFRNAISMTGKHANWDWDLTNVTAVTNMFYGCLIFDADLSNFKVHTLNGGGASSLGNMLYDCRAFNNGGSPNINNWDTSNVTSLSSLFYNNDAFNQPVGNWDTSNVTTLYQIFYKAAVFNQNVGSWDVSNVTTMYRLFRDATQFTNGGSDSIVNWDVSNVTTFGDCFYGCTSFNYPLGSWDVSGVTGTTPFQQMFYNCQSFNQPLTAWSSSIRGSLQGMFYNADSFDQDLGSWDMSSVTSLYQFMYGAAIWNNASTGSINSWDMSSCTTFFRAFRACSQFNQPIGGWTMNTSSNYSVQEMLRVTTSFDQSLAGWNISKLSNGTNFLNGVTLSTNNYDATLVAWGAQSGSVISGINMHFGNSEYTSGSLADQRRQDLIDAGWTITDGGYA